ncbi:MAG: cytochrome c peroxidase [Gammaproteobacteria bacterium]
MRGAHRAKACPSRRTSSGDLRASVIVTILIAGLATGFDARAQAISLSYPDAGSYELPPLKPAGDGEIVTSTGTVTTLHELYAGKLVVLSLVYTRCADAQGCPWATALLGIASKRLDRDEPTISSRARFITLSFDPEHDSPEVMRRYGAPFAKDGDWVFATTRSPAALAPILRAYGQNLQPEPSGTAGAGLAHLLRVFLIDENRMIRNIYGASVLDPALLANDLKTLVLEQAAGLARPRSGKADKPEKRRADSTRWALDPPLGLPQVPVPADNPLTEAKVALGRMLFYDRRLSLNNTMSCAMCHIPDQGFTNNALAAPAGIEGRSVRRNAPSLYNVAYQEHLFHDGREISLETQVWSPLLARNEMGAPSVGWVLDKVRRSPDYQGLFERAFGRPAGMTTIGQAIASYERTLISGNTPFDRWYYGGNRTALGRDAQRGFKLFTGKARCGACHALGHDHALFTDQEPHNTGIGWQRSMHTRAAEAAAPIAPGLTVAKHLLEAVSEPPPSDLGRYEVTQDPADRWRYKTPSLRNVALTAPYMHDGSFATLADVLAYYNRGGYAAPDRDPLIETLGLSTMEQNDLLVFLESLTGDNVREIAADGLAAPVGDPKASARAP